MWALLSICAVAIALLGGSSRPDAVQIVILRPLCALLLIPALYFLTSRSVETARVPLLLFSLLILWAIVQIIPLPPSLWASLPERGLISDIDSLVLNEEVWRPISLVPSRGHNALAAFIVPASAALLALATSLRTKELLLIVAALGVLDAAMGFLQSFAGPTSPLFFYSVTNKTPVGLFANENHSGAFSAIAMLAAARIALEPRWSAQKPWLRIFGIAAFVTTLLALITNGSRAGFVAGLFALGCCVALFYFSATRSASSSISKAKTKNGHTRAGAQRTAIGVSGTRPFALLAAGLVFILLLLALFVINGRAAGLEDIIQADSLEDLRWRLLPVLQSMMATHWMAGTGFGSFEEVYHIYEPTDLLYPFYVNQAHNDWAQFVIEGGAPAVLLLLGLLAWIARNLLQCINTAEKRLLPAIHWGGTFMIIMAVSFPDYPLRTPLFQAVAVWLVIGLAKDQIGQERAIEPKRSVGG